MEALRAQRDEQPAKVLHTLHAHDPITAARCARGHLASQGLDVDHAMDDPVGKRHDPWVARGQLPAPGRLREAAQDAHAATPVGMGIQQPLTQAILGNEPQVDRPRILLKGKGVNAKARARLEGILRHKPPGKALVVFRATSGSWLAVVWLSSTGRAQTIEDVSVEAHHAMSGKNGEGKKLVVGRLLLALDLHEIGTPKTGGADGVPHAKVEHKRGVVQALGSWSITRQHGHVKQQAHDVAQLPEERAVPCLRPLAQLRGQLTLNAHEPRLAPVLWRPLPRLRSLYEAPVAEHEHLDAIHKAVTKRPPELIIEGNPALKSDGILRAGRLGRAVAWSRVVGWSCAVASLGRTQRQAVERGISKPHPHGSPVIPYGLVLKVPVRLKDGAHPVEHLKHLVVTHEKRHHLSLREPLFPPNAQAGPLACVSRHILRHCVSRHGPWHERRAPRKGILCLLDHAPVKEAVSVLGRRSLSRGRCAHASVCELVQQDPGLGREVLGSQPRNVLLVRRAESLIIEHELDGRLQLKAVARKQALDGLLSQGDPPAEQGRTVPAS